MHFIMGLREDFQPTMASLLSRSPTPSLDVAVKELIPEENHWPTYHMSSSDHVLATPSLSPQHSLLLSQLLNNLPLGIPSLSLRKVLAASFVVPRAMISLFVTNYRNSCKTRIKLYLLRQLLCVPQIYQFLPVHP